MILSHSQKFVFIKGVKVAGTSLEMALASLCSNRDIITPLVPRDEAARCAAGRGCQNFGYSKEDEDAYKESIRNDHLAASFPFSMFYNHMSYQEVVAKTNANLDTYLYVCAERNPYCKVLSLICYEQHSRRYLQGYDIKPDLDRLQKQVSFYIRSKKILHALNIGRYCSGTRRFPDFVIRYEHLEADFAALMARLGIATPPPLPHAKKSILANTLDLAGIYRRDQLDAINELFQHEFALFGYPML